MKQVLLLLLFFAGVVQSEILYQDNFDNDSLAVNTNGIGGGALNRTISGHSWIDDGDATFVTSGTQYTKRAFFYSERAFTADAGFKLTVYYATGSIGNSLAHAFSFGLIRADTDFSTYTDDNPFKVTTNVYSFGVNLTQDEDATEQGLNFTDGSTCTTLDQSGDNVQFLAGTSTPVVIEISEDGAWSYSINGTNEASGVIDGGFDMDSGYHVVVYGQDDNGGGKSIQSILLEREQVAEDFYVATTGSDTNSGTLAAPFATIQHAVDRMSAGDTCYIRGGTYHEEIDLSGVAGISNAPVTLVNYNEETVVLDGTAAITNRWTLDEGAIYKTTVTEDITQLFVGDQLMTLARFPNALAFSDSMWSYASHRQREASTSRFTVIDNPDAGASDALVGAGVSFNDCVAVCNFADHITYARLVKNHVAGSNTFDVAWMEKIGTSNYYFFEGGTNNAERVMLDMAEEWAYDESTKTVYLWPEDGQDPTGSEIFGKTQDYAITGGANTSYIVIDGLDFWATTFSFESSDHITIQNCDSDYYAASKRALGDITEAETATFIGTETDFCEDILIYNCAFRHADGGGLYSSYTANMQIENNLFYQIDYANIDNFATVQMNNSQDLVYRRNTMETAGSGAGMSASRYKVGTVRPVTVEYNFHTDCARKQGDGSSVYMPHDDVVESVARYNWFIGNYERDFRWDGWNDPLLGTNANFYCNVAMSTLIKAVAVGDGCHLKGDGHEVYNNTGIGKWSSIEVSIGKGGNAHSVSRNNAADLLDDYLDQDSNTNYFSSDAWFDTTNSTYHRIENDWGLPGEDSHNVAAQNESFGLASLLRDSDNWDFRPRADASVLIDQGTNVTCTVNGVTYDVTAGYVGDAPDIGAYEYGADAYWIPGRQEAQASMPIPKAGGVAVPLDADLMYLIGLGGVRANIYLGTSSNNLEFVATQDDPHNIVEFAGDPGLEENQHYYWRVDTELADGSVVMGEVWSFDTVGMIPMISKTVSKSAYWDPATNNYGTVTSYTYNNVGISFDRYAILYSADSYQSTEGFRLTVYYTIGLLDDGAANHFSFGLISDETDLSTYSGVNPFCTQTNVYSLGVNLTVRAGAEKQGLNFTDGSVVTNLDQSGDNVEFRTKWSTPVVIEIRPDGAWSYSINGTTEASGTIAGGFDLSKSYHVVVYGQDDNGNGKSIQDVALELLETTEPDGLVAHWPLDESFGLLASDATGHGYDGSVSSAQWVSGVSGNALEFDGSTSRVTLPSTAFSTVNDEVTISMWAFGSDSLPANTSVFFAADTNENRCLNIHLPYGTSIVYWDAGNNGTVDRISKTAMPSEYQGQWNHWVFTKNAVSGEMKIYLNGSVWQAGTGKSKSIGDVADASFGAQLTTLNYAGVLDDVRLYDVALSAQEVADLYAQNMPEQTYLNWASAYDLIGDNALYEADLENGGMGDGYNNLAEYALGMNPILSDVGTRDWEDLALEGGTNWFDYVYYRRTNWFNEGLSYELLDSTNLVDSVISTNTQVQTFTGTAEGNYEPVTNRYRTDDPVKFIQLKIQKD
jgi:hypothetical protein